MTTTTKAGVLGVLDKELAALAEGIARGDKLLSEYRINSMDFNETKRVRDELRIRHAVVTEARRAVAELVEAARDELEGGFNVANTPSRQRLAAALAAIGGEG